MNNHWHCQWQCPSSLTARTRQHAGQRMPPPSQLHGETGDPAAPRRCPPIEWASGPLGLPRQTRTRPQAHNMPVGCCDSDCRHWQCQCQWLLALALPLLPAPSLGGIVCPLPQSSGTASRYPSPGWQRAVAGTASERGNPGGQQDKPPTREGGALSGEAGVGCDFGWGFVVPALPPIFEYVCLLNRCSVV
jgi:hypothetical protein